MAPKAYLIHARGIRTTMALDLKKLSKLETPPASVQAAGASGGDHVLVIVKLREGFVQTPYIEARAEYGPSIFSAEIEFSELARLEADPAVASVSLSRRLTSID